MPIGFVSERDGRVVQVRALSDSAGAKAPALFFVLRSAVAAIAARQACTNTPNGGNAAKFSNTPSFKLKLGLSCLRMNARSSEGNGTEYTNGRDHHGNRPPFYALFHAGSRLKAKGPLGRFSDPTYQPGASATFDTRRRLL